MSSMKRGLLQKLFKLEKSQLSVVLLAVDVAKQSSVFLTMMENDFLYKMKGADGVVFGTPVYFAGVSGVIKSFMDRVFFANAAVFRGKPGAIIASCRRGGASAALDGLSKYLAYAEMPIVSGRYWNMIHGNTAEEVKQDLEGMENLRFLGRNMAWLLECIEAGMRAGIEMPEYERKTWTNFIR